jgi:4-hydroxybenzoate polyprenyltransferase
MGFITIWTIALIKYTQGALFYIAIAAAMAQVVWHFSLIRTRSRDGCFTAFRQNHWLGFAVFAGIAATYAMQ